MKRISPVLALTFILIFLVTSRILVLGKEGEWVWKYHKISFWWRAFFPFLVSSLFILLIYLLKRFPLSRRMVILLLFLFTFLIQISFQYFTPLGVSQNVVVLSMPWISGYFTEAMVFRGGREYFQKYPDSVTYRHVKLRPPLGMLMTRGIIKLFYSSPSLTRLFLKVTSATIFDSRRSFSFLESKMGWKLADYEKASLIFLGIFLTLLCSAGIIPLYLWLLREGENSLIFSAFYAFIPSLLLFSPSFDFILPLFVALILYTISFRNRNIFWSGVFTAIGVLFSLSLLLVFIFAVVYMLMDREKRRYILLYLGGFLALILFFYLLTGFSLLRYMLRLTPAFTEEGRRIFLEVKGERSYGFWVLYDPVEFFLFAGIPLSYLFFCGWRKTPPRFKYVFTGVFLFLNFSGVSLSEVGRLWSFLYPFLFLPALNSRERYLLPLLSLEFLQSLFFKASLDVFSLFP